VTLPRPLALFDAPLDRTVLIEASAGTGKTWTVTGLYLRLLLEAGLAVREILVVTFTEAATEELRDRIRDRLNAARAILAGQAAGDDAFTLQIREHYGGRPEALQRLTNALRSYDEAAIYTIHGFCQRALADSAFEGARPFEMDLLPDERRLVQEIVDDFWRRELHGISPLLSARLLAGRLGPEVLAAAVYRHAGKPFLKIEAPAPAERTAAEADYEAAYERARALWRAHAADVRALLLADGFNRSRYRLESVARWMTQLEVALGPEAAALALFPELDRFTPARLAEGTNRGFAAPAHPFFDACAALLEAQERLARSHEATIAALKAKLLVEVNRELVVRKDRARVQSYNDLLLRLDQALAEEAGDALARALRGRYRAALIDEFQDTDPVQLGIFRRLYEDAGAPVFFVGDPKQAIYSFRGADVYAYLSAGRDVQAHYTLDTNWRSHPRLIRAVNALFHRARPFLLDGIAFHPAQPASRQRVALSLPGDAEPLRLWYIGAGDNGKPCTKDRAAALATQATAAEIARLLTLSAEGKARIGENALTGGDIAVLVRTHRQGRMIREALGRLGIPSVQHSQDSVYASHEALELERVLLAVAEPLREPLVRAALSTDMLGVGAAELLALERDPLAWEARRARFDDYHALWRGRGFMHVFRELLAREEVLGRLLALADGERRVTNLMHLGELLHQAAHDTVLGLSGLAQWLAEKRARPEADDEAAQLRLESDAALVKVVTVHKSKGLQYPIVFCPFLWDGKLRTRADKDIAYHDPRVAERATVHFGCPPDAPAREQAAREELAENLRLLYVALTRAEHRCYLVHGCINEAQTSPLAWLLYGDDELSIAALEARVIGLGDAGLYETLAGLAAASTGDIALERVGPAASSPWQGASQGLGALAARTLARPVDPGWRITSFTALAAGRDAELPDYDAPILSAPVLAARFAARDIHAFPRGTGPGQCLHAILEQVDFARPDPADVARIARRQLEAHGIGTEWVETVCRLVDRVRHTPLAPDGLRLAEVTRPRRVDELEFYYPLARVDAPGLRRLLARHGYDVEPYREQIESLAFAPVHGYMKGFIDVVFEAGGRYHLADYKSNWLGHGIDDYAAARLPPVIAEAGYHLQYLVYTVALHRYLATRIANYDYDAHVGEVYYLFLRGMDPQAGAGYGVHRDRPSRALVLALDDYFRTGCPEAGR
jgi:exodeoxyribonuclease V beta subunit